jgi:hypothetical protein
MPRQHARQINALDELQRRGHAESSHDLAAAGDVGTALFAGACLDSDPRFPIVDVM